MPRERRHHGNPCGSQISARVRWDHARTPLTPARLVFVDMAEFRPSGRRSAETGTDGYREIVRIHNESVVLWAVVNTYGSALWGDLPQGDFGPVTCEISGLGVRVPIRPAVAGRWPIRLRR